MSLILRQSTAKAVSFGPFVDKTDGVTPEVGLVTAIDHGTTGILLSKNGGALTIRHASVTASTYDAYGNYIVTLDTTDTNTVGTLRMQFIETATCLPVWLDFQIVEEAVFDELLAASALGYIANAPVTLADAVAHGGTLGSSTATLALQRLNVTSQTSNTAAVTVTGNGTGNGATIASGSGATGTGLAVSSAATNGSAITATGNGSGSGMAATGGATGAGIVGSGGGTSGAGIRAVATAGNSSGMAIAGSGANPGLQIDGGATGYGFYAAGGGTSGGGVLISSTSGNGIDITPTAGHGINIAANGTSKHGILSTGGTAGTSDGIKAVAGSGGVPIRGDITGNITGALSGAVGSVTGNVGGSVADVLAIAGSTTAAGNLKSGALGVVPSTAAAGCTTTSIVTNLTEATDDHYNGGAIVFTSGALLGQRSSISDYVGATKTLTVVALTEAPASTDSFVIV